MNRGAELPEPADGVPLSDIEWDVLRALEIQMDLEGPGIPAPGVLLMMLVRQLWAFLRWWVDPRYEGLPMPKLLVREA